MVQKKVFYPPHRGNSTASGKVRVHVVEDPQPGILPGQQAQQPFIYKMGIEDSHMIPAAKGLHLFGNDPAALGKIHGQDLFSHALQQPKPVPVGSFLGETLDATNVPLGQLFLQFQQGGNEIAAVDGRIVA